MTPIITELDPDEAEWEIAPEANDDGLMDRLIAEITGTAEPARLSVPEPTDAELYAEYMAALEAV